MMTRALVLRIPVGYAISPKAISYITDALGECARSLEDEESKRSVANVVGAEPFGLIADLDDRGRYAWEIVQEGYPE